MKYKVTSEFNAVDMVRNGIPHTGIDLAMPTGTDLRSVMDGWVSKVWDGSGTLGKGVTIKGLDGREYIYGHMDKVAMKVGDAVKFGTYIGDSGNTGRSTGSHLHFAVKENGQYIDPSQYTKALDELSGKWVSGPGNTKEQLAELVACKPNTDLHWWDVQGKIQNKFDMAVCEQKQEFYSYLQALLETTVELSFSIALIGGGILIMLKVAGSTRATKYFTILQISHIFIRAMFGGLK